MAQNGARRTTTVTWTAGEIWEVKGVPDTHSSTPSSAVKTHIVGSRGSASEFWDRGHWFESGVSHNALDALQDHCSMQHNSGYREGNLPLRQKKIFKKQAANVENISS